MPTPDIFPVSGLVIDDDAWLPLARSLADGVDRIGDGLALTKGTGLNVDVTAGAAVVNGYLVSPGATSVAVTDSTTNYIFLNDDETFTANTTGTQPANSVWLGSATTSGGAVTSVTNHREADAAFRYKVAATTKTSSDTTLTVDPDLAFTISSGQIWEVTIVWGLDAQSGTGGGVDLGITAPTNAGLYGFVRQARHGQDTSGTGNYLTDLALNGTGEQTYSPNTSLNSGYDPAPGWAHFIVEANQDDGTVGLTWAHGGSGDDTDLVAGAFLVARRIRR